MVSTQMTLGWRRAPASVLVLLLVVAFALGAVAGSAVQSTLDRGTVAAVTAIASVKGVADNNMSDAANRAQHGVAPGVMPAATVKGVADNNMSDAARHAVYGTGN